MIRVIEQQGPRAGVRPRAGGTAERVGRHRSRVGPWSAALLVLFPFLVGPAPRTLAQSDDWRSWGGRIGPVAAEADGPAFLAWGTRILRVAPDDGALELEDVEALPEVVEGLAAGHGLLAATHRAAGGRPGARLRIWALDADGPPRALGAAVNLGGRDVGEVAIGYGRAFVLTERGLATWYLKDPSAPRLEAEVAGKVPVGARAWEGRLILGGGRLWLARPWGLEWLDLQPLESGAGALTLRRHDDMPTRDLAVAGSRLYALRADGRLTLLDAADGTVLAEAMTADRPLALGVAGQRLAVVDQDGRRLRRFRITDASLPFPVGGPVDVVSLPPQPSAQARLILRDDEALLSLGGMGIWRRAGDGQPAEVLSLLPSPEQVWPDRSRFWVAAGAAGLWSVERNQAGGPARIRGQVLLAGPTGLRLAAPDQPNEGRAAEIQAVTVVEGRVVVLTACDGLAVLRRDVSGALSLTGLLVGLATQRGGGGLLPKEERLIGLSPGGGLWTVDLKDLSRPQILGRSGDLGILDLAPLPEGGLAFVGMGALGQGRFGVGGFDGAGVAQPPATWLDLDRVYSRVAVQDRLVVLSGAAAGLAIVEVDGAGGARLLQQYSGAVSGRALLQDDLLHLAEDQALNHFLLQAGGSLLPLGRSFLPAPGAHAGGGHDLLRGDGMLLLPRGQAGLLALAAGDEAVEDAPASRQGAASVSYLPALAISPSDAPAAAPSCRRAAGWLVLWDERLAPSSNDPHAVAADAGMQRLASSLRDSGLVVHLGRFGSQAELLTGDGLPDRGLREGGYPSPARADLGLALGLRLVESSAQGTFDLMGILLSLAGPLDGGTQRLLRRQEAILAARGQPVLRLDIEPAGLSVDLPAIPAAAEIRRAVAQGDWTGLAGGLAQACW